MIVKINYWFLHASYAVLCLNAHRYPHTSTVTLLKVELLHWHWCSYEMLGIMTFPLQVILCGVSGLFRLTYCINARLGSSTLLVLGAEVIISDYITYDQMAEYLCFISKFLNFQGLVLKYFSIPSRLHFCHIRKGRLPYFNFTLCSTSNRAWWLIGEVGRGGGGQWKVTWLCLQHVQVCLKH